MTYIRILFNQFERMISGWTAWQIALLVAILPIITVILQLALFDRASRFYKANRRLNKFLKKNCYISSINLFLFNKKVCRVFPVRLQKVLKSFEGKDISMQELCTIFENYRVKAPVNIIGITYIVHVIAVSVIMAMSGYYLSHIAFVALGMTIAWGLIYIACNFIRSLYRNRESRAKGKFLFGIKHNVQEVVNFSFIDNGIEYKSDSQKVTEDSVYELAQGVEEFLAANPNKSLAKVVYKSLYSANFASAMSKESVFSLKNAMQKLKNYIQ